MFKINQWNRGKNKIKVKNVFFLKKWCKRKLKIELFIKLLSDDSSYLFQILFNVIENDYKVLQLIDLFAGQKIQFPDRKKVHRLLEKIKIYTFVKHSNNKDNACKLLAKQYNKRILQIRTIVDRIDYLLANGDYRDIEKLKESAKED